MRRMLPIFIALVFVWSNLAAAEPSDPLVQADVPLTEACNGMTLAKCTQLPVPCDVNSDCKCSGCCGRSGVCDPPPVCDRVVNPSGGEEGSEGVS